MYQEFLDTKRQIEELEAKKLQIECAIYEKHQANLKQGSNTIDEDGFKIKITLKDTIKVDQVKAQLVPFGFRIKFELDAKAYKNLTDEEKKVVDECTTVTPAKPYFQVEKL